MVEPKVSENTLNRYNHNFHLRWCICDGLDIPPMVQCICCDDWFHHKCIGFFSNLRCIVLDETPCLSDWIFVCNECIAHRLEFLDEFPDADPPEAIRDFVLELQTDYGIKPFTERPNHGKIETEIDLEGENNGSEKVESLSEMKARLMRDGFGFTIFGGKWVPKDEFFKFKGEPEFDAEFAKIDPTEEDRQLPVSFRQKEIARFMRKTYEDIFKRVSKDGRTVIQKSDTDAVLGKNASQLLMDRRRSRDHDDDDNDNDGGTAI